MRLDPIIHLFLFVCIVILFAGFLFQQKKIDITSLTVDEIKNSLNSFVSGSPKSGDSTPLSFSPAPTATNQPTVSPQKASYVSSPTPQKQIVYLNLNGTFTTKNTDWTDVTSSDVWIDLANEYSKDAYVDWEAFVSVGSKDSIVFVRLFDTTNKIGVNGSDMTSTSTVTARVSSGKLNLWSGHNLYRVQVKSLNGIDASFNSGRIKIVY